MLPIHIIHRLRGGRLWQPWAVERKLPVLVFALALVGLIVGAAGGPTWWPSAHSHVAAELDHSAIAPLYGLVANVAAALPFGELGFRLAVLSAVLGAALLAGVVAAARVVLPKDPVAWIVAAVLLAAAPAFRDAAGFAGPDILAACGIVWMIRFTATSCWRPALGCAAVVLGSAPWLGAALVALGIVWLARERFVLAIGAVGVICVILWLPWLGAIGSLPRIAPSIDTLAGMGRGAGAIVFGAGLLGIGFAAVTGLAFARRLAVFAALALVHTALVGGDISALAVVALGCAVIPSAIVRAVGATGRRHLVALGAGLPLVAAAALTGPAITVDSPGATPARVADDLIGEAPPGPGIVVPVNDASKLALEYARVVAGARPDLALAPTSDVAVADALRSNRVVISEVSGFGRLDPRRSVARGRGFQLLGGLPAVNAPVAPPAHYDSAMGHDLSLRFALERARFEANAGRLDAAARAAGLTKRFRAGDLAVLGATRPTLARPPFYRFLPITSPDVEVEVFGDDLAWVAHLDEPALPDNAPDARRLHARWRLLWLGKTTPNDPEIAALGPAALAATAAMLATYGAVQPQG
jgi:hypothetical protein